jgi:inosine triphosphate pyrophosphatase
MNKIIYFVTGNKNKVIELESILHDNDNDNFLYNTFTYKIEAYKLDLPELQGEPEYIATEKCRLASLQIDGPVMIEDTSLCFNALGGLPGPYVKWFLDKTGLEGLNKLLLGYEDKSAYAQTIFAFTEGKDKPIHLFIGKVDGKIVSARGNLGFGWDAIFQPDCENNNETFGEMDKTKKNKISHRYLALQKVKEYFEVLD